MGGIPMLQVGDWLACEWVREVDDCHVLDVELHDVVERLNAG